MRNRKNAVDGKIHCSLKFPRFLIGKYVDFEQCETKVVVILVYSARIGNALEKLSIPNDVAVSFKSENCMQVTRLTSVCEERILEHQVLAASQSDPPKSIYWFEGVGNNLWPRRIKTIPASGGFWNIARLHKSYGLPSSCLTMEPQLCFIQFCSSVLGCLASAWTTSSYSSSTFANRFPSFRMLPKFAGANKFLVASRKLLPNH